MPYYIMSCAPNLLCWYFWHEESCTFKPSLQIASQSRRLCSLAAGEANSMSKQIISLSLHGQLQILRRHTINPEFIQCLSNLQLWVSHRLFGCSAKKIRVGRRITVGKGSNFNFGFEVKVHTVRRIFSQFRGSSKNMEKKRFSLQTALLLAVLIR